MAANITIRHYVPPDENVQDLYEILSGKKEPSRYNYPFAGNTQDREAC